ncbi:MAG: type II secretion system protein GspE, partial [Candidatus Moranbacteria bacterium]|nr:type II secretion system protein GspE [Candidatus Moranbacteria bacterium]
MTYIRLGDLLVSSGIINEKQLSEALAVQKKTGDRLGDVLLNNNVITEPQLIEALQIQLGVDFVDLTSVTISVELTKYVPRNLAKKYGVVPVKIVGGELYI